MFRLYLTSLRFAVGLACIGAGLLLLCHWIGVVPDTDRIERDARAKRCDALAVATTGMIRTGDWANLEATLWTLTRRDPELLSLGVRTVQGTLRVDTGRHRELWALAETHPGLSIVHVPIRLNKHHWGQLEFCYAEKLRGTWGWVHHPLIQLLTVFMLVGTVVYAMFISRALGVFNSTQVVPDRVRQALDTLAEGLLVLDEDEKIILANGAFTARIGVPTSELQGKKASQLPWETEQGTAPDTFPWRNKRDSDGQPNSMLLRYRIGDEERCVFSINSATIESSDRGRRGTLVTLRDVTQLEQNRTELETMLTVLKDSRDEISRKNRELEVLATQDSLTGCFNRRAFFERFEVAFRFSKQYGVPLSCVMVDNDYFKAVNDNYGHHIGDEVLRKVGALLCQLHGDAQVVCRFGGEEFCIMLPGFDLEAAAKAAERIRIGITEIRLENPSELRLSASIGVTDMSFDADDPQSMINQADVCLYVAKRSGRNRVICFDPSMLHEAADAGDGKLKNINKSAEVISAASPPVRSLLAALAFRDADTAEHSRRVANYCVQTARGFFNTRELNLIEVAGLLHDIGKIGVPDHILLKPGSLTDAEWKLMGMHDQISVEIVANLIESEDLLSVIKCHHCRFGGDGEDNGCPVGNDIPVAARILTISDSYDAMVSDRIYRKGRSHEEAVAELRRCAGKQFDPVWVERFVDAFVENNAAEQRLETSGEPAIKVVHISKQIERLIEAVDLQDSVYVKSLSERVRRMAQHCDMDELALAAQSLEETVDHNDDQWEDILLKTESLIDLCRAAQDRMVRFD